MVNMELETLLKKLDELKAENEQLVSALGFQKQLNKDMNEAWNAELENYAKLANRAIEDEAAGVTEINKLREKLRVAVTSLESISKNSCCNQCQEAKLVAVAALDKMENDGDAK